MAEALEDLVVDETEVDREQLRELLAPYVRLARGTGEPIPTAAFSKLSASGKIVVYALSRKAGRVLNLTSGPESATPKQISVATGVKNGTTKPTVVALAMKGLLISENGRYSVPNHALPRIREAIEQGASKAH